MQTTSGSAAFVIDDKRKTVSHPKRGVKRLSPQQFWLLAFLHAHKGEVFSVRDLLERVWFAPDYSTTSDDVVRMTVMGIRKRLGRDAIETVPNYGYGVGIDS